MRPIIAIVQIEQEHPAPLGVLDLNSRKPRSSVSVGFIQSFLGFVEEEIRDKNDQNKAFRDKFRSL